MTIKDYMRKVESEKMTPKDSAGASFTDAMMENTEIWSNDACVGYFLRAAQIVGLDQADTRKVVEAFKRRERLSEFYRKLVWASINSN